MMMQDIATYDTEKNAVTQVVLTFFCEGKQGARSQGTNSEMRSLGTRVLFKVAKKPMVDDAIRVRIKGQQIEMVHQPIT